MVFVSDFVTIAPMLGVLSVLRSSKAVVADLASAKRLPQVNNEAKLKTSVSVNFWHSAD